MSNAYEIFSDVLLHMNWHRKNDLQQLTPEIRPFLCGVLADYCRKDGGLSLELGGSADRVHLVAEILPTVTISGWIGDCSQRVIVSTTVAHASRLKLRLLRLLHLHGMG